ncbi:MAG: NAD(P)/FAD-dependent oxidoreductase [Nitrososphaerota archaeon]|nr:NAD(P)/FAD-dependent oxidoreductase [Candidatus Bathyarchaeota archaeon]MDW8062254.1 NAD(P)/FAD-dependent oxidoreductase [Nitrososphaerota archaeon]
MTRYDTIVIGGGPAGLSAALKLKAKGFDSLVIESGDRIGGIPLQCIHPGFGLHYLGEDLTGTEFIHRLIGMVEDQGVEYRVRSHVVRVKPSRTGYPYKRIEAVSPYGFIEVETPILIYTAGARERTIFEIGVTGERLSGVFTAGEAQAYMDIFGILPGSRIVIIGSGDVGLIMARRFALEGAKVEAVIEMMPWPGGLTRNIVQCLLDYDIPLLLSRMVVRLEGKRRVEGVVTVRVDEDLNPIPGSEELIECDTVVVSAGLTPNVRLLEGLGLAMDPSTRGPIVDDYLESITYQGIFIAGNALVVNDLVDYVVEQGESAAEGASILLYEGVKPRSYVRITKGRNVRLIVPQYLSCEKDAVLYMRVQKPEYDVKVCFEEISREFRYPVVRPAEMIRLTLRRSDLEDLRRLDSLTVEVKRV